MTNNAEFNVEDYKAKKKAEVDHALEMLKEETESIIFDKGQFTAYLDTQARFNMYSVANAILITKQKPDAVQLKTFDDWKEKNLQIKKGEKSIKIIEPREYEKKNGEKGRGYKVKGLFDVSQTNSSFIPAYFSNLNENQLIKALISNPPVAIEAVEAIDDGFNAKFDIRNQKIFVKRGLEPNALFRDVAVELAHAQFAVDNYGYERGQHEYKARMAAYMLCKRYGIDVKDFAVALPDSFHEMKHKDVRKEFDSVRKVMNEINERMRNALDKQRAERSDQER